MPRHSRTPRVEKETISAAIPKWKKRQVEAIGDQRGDKTISATVEHALDQLRAQYGYPEHEESEGKTKPLPRAA